MMIIEFCHCVFPFFKYELFVANNIFYLIYSIKQNACNSKTDMEKMTQIMFDGLRIACVLMPLIAFILSANKRRWGIALIGALIGRISTPQSQSNELARAQYSSHQ